MIMAYSSWKTHKNIEYYMGPWKNNTESQPSEKYVLLYALSTWLGHLLHKWLHQYGEAWSRCGACGHDEEEAQGASVAAFSSFKHFVSGGSWCTDSCLSPLLVKLPQIVKCLCRACQVLRALSQALVNPVACAPFPPTFSFHWPLWICWYSALWKDNFFSNDILRLTLLTVGVNDTNCLHNCQVSSLRLSDHFKGSGNLSVLS